MDNLRVRQSQQEVEKRFNQRGVPKGKNTIQGLEVKAQPLERVMSKEDHGRLMNLLTWAMEPLVGLKWVLVQTAY